jgi:hypothetical protein
MGVITYEGTVVQGQIRLKDDIRLPESTRVYVIVPGVAKGEKSARVASPRLAEPNQAADFKMEVSEETRDAGV